MCDSAQVPERRAAGSKGDEHPNGETDPVARKVVHLDAFRTMHSAHEQFTADPLTPGAA